MNAQTAFALINPQTKAPAFKIFSFEDGSYFNEVKNYNYYNVILIFEGDGVLNTNISAHTFDKQSAIFLSIYQPFAIKANAGIKGLLLSFHPDFFCIHKHQHEVSCNGVLFNNIYDSPVLALSADDLQTLTGIAEMLKTEMQKPELAQYELMVSYLKIFLINASRLKVSSGPANQLPVSKEPFILQNLKDAIEEYYKTKHSPSDYSGLLHISTRALNRISKIHFNKTLTNLIAERIVIEAKRELYLTSKPVKRIAYDLGFNDEFYFSRFFKSNAEVSPQVYRDTVGFARAEVA
ncbi:MAG: helix-turn-helix domain-containing protein [Mucilaginibacter sp.]